ncbi:MAG: four-carbon acid sugar kinase family protein [Sphingobacteriaceae bacterium]
MKEGQKLLLAFYGDDFTGSTDALEFLTLAGVKTVLFLQTPEPKDLKRFSGLQAIGLAGKSRSMSPAEMETELFPAFEHLQKFKPAQVHYKVCSTFDSAPHVGNIGKAIAIGSQVFAQKTVFVSPAAPHLGRYCVFGNLFARMGTAGAGDIYRIDRHPSMSKHPVTPAEEADLRLHLARQTEKSIGLVPLTTVEEGQEAVLSAVKNHAETDILFLDAFNYSHIQTIGHVFHELGKEKTLFTVGSSGIEMALGMAWKDSGIMKDQIQFLHPGKASPLLVFSGSCSPVTEKQINHALENGFAGIPLPPEALSQKQEQAIIQSISQQIVLIMDKGQSVILHTSLGSSDPRIQAAEQLLSSSGIAPQDIQKQSSKQFGKVMGQIAKTVLKNHQVQRILFAGGDTSSYAASELGIMALEMIAPLAPGAPLCKALAQSEEVNGLELNFKGGQVGTPDYFIKVLNGEKI